jgi:hypothetical protein
MIREGTGNPDPTTIVAPGPPRLEVRGLYGSGPQIVNATDGQTLTCWWTEVLRFRSRSAAIIVGGRQMAVMVGSSGGPSCIDEDAIPQHDPRSAPADREPNPCLP